MSKAINIYKPVGKTPYQLVNDFKKAYPMYKNTKIGYAGRLDPLAHGVMILLTYPETQKSYLYQSLDKEYKFKALFGFSTDTYDILGIPKYHRGGDRVTEQVLRKFAYTLTGNYDQPYPPYSSKMVRGKPLFWWARRNRLINISIPTKNITIYKLKLLSMEKISKTRLTSLIKTKINKVAGDFRQEIIMQKWQDLLQKNKKEKFITSTFKLRCSSGTYVRSLVNKLGNEFQTGAVTLDIFRTKVGNYDYRNSVKLSRLVRPVTVL